MRIEQKAKTSNGDKLEQIVSAMEQGVIVADSDGRVVWADEKAKQTAGLKLNELPEADAEKDAVNCAVSTIDLTLAGETKEVCVVQEAPSPGDTKHEFAAAVESFLEDAAHFTQSMTERLKIWRSPSPAADPSDLDALTEREREILALICVGRTDAEMSKLLNLSQNTVRNHVASLYRKIGVNRRAAAIIWARERGLSSEQIANNKRRSARSRAPRR